MTNPTLYSCIYCKVELPTANKTQHDHYVHQYLYPKKPRSYGSCKHCSNKIRSYEKKIFCNLSCAASYNNTIKPKRKSTKVMKPCLYCNNPTNGKYCSTKCSGESRRLFTDSTKALQYKRSRVRETSAHYRAKLKKQTPVDADRNAIKEFYTNCPIGYEVDHIIPISKGGKHSLENLQYLTISENRKKSNKMVDPQRVELCPTGYEPVAITTLA